MILRVIALSSTTRIVKIVLLPVSDTFPLRSDPSSWRELHQRSYPGFHIECRRHRVMALSKPSELSGIHPCDATILPCLEISPNSGDRIPLTRVGIEVPPRAEFLPRSSPTFPQRPP